MKKTFSNKNFFNSKKVFIVAEAGNNHEGDFIKAKKLISAASKCGADAIKFQFYNIKKFY